MIRDGAGSEITYLVLTLDAGQDSDPIAIEVDVPVVGILRASRGVSRDEGGAEVVVDAVTTYARPAGSVDLYTDITNEGLDLSGFVGPTQEFDIIFAASGEVEDLPRITVNVGVSSSGSAAW